MIDGSCIQYGQAVLKVYAVRESLLSIRHDFLSSYERTLTISVRVSLVLGLLLLLSSTAHLWCAFAFAFA